MQDPRRLILSCTDETSHALWGERRVVRVPLAADAAHQRITSARTHVIPDLVGRVRCRLTFRRVVSQILRACTRLEELTLHNCGHVAGGHYTRHSSPFLGATAALLHAGPSKDIYHPARWGNGNRGLRDLQLHWDASQQHARVTRFMLMDLAPIPSTIHADSVALRVPRAAERLPAALELVCRSMRLVRRGSVAHLESDVAGFRSRCKLVAEGVCFDDVVASWVPLTRADRVENYDGYDSEIEAYWNEDDTVEAASDLDES